MVKWRVNLHLLLIVSNPRVFKHLLGVANSAIARTHKVTVFFNEESVKLLLDHNSLGNLGVDLLACVTSCEYSGIKQENMVDGARVSSLGEVIQLMEEVDRTLFLG